MSQDENRSVYRRLQRARLTPSERSVAEVLLADYPQAGLLSSRMLARTARVSGATVSRLAAKLGYGDFTEMQESMRTELRTRLTSPTQRLQSARPSLEDGPAALLQAVFHQDIDNLTQALSSLDPDEFDAIVDRLADSRRRIWVVGSKKGYVPAMYLSVQLRQIRPGVHLIALDDTLPDQFADAEPADVLVAFGPRRRTHQLVNAVDHFVALGAEVVAISDDLPPPELTGVWRLVTLPTNGHGIFDSYVAMVTFVNAVLASLVAKNRDQVRERMVGLEEMTVEMGIWHHETDHRRGEAT